MPQHDRNFKRKRLRSFFTIQEKKPQYSDTLEEIENQLINLGMTYLQMNLPVDSITPAFEDHIRSQIDNEINIKILRASEHDLETILHLYNLAWSSTHTPLSVMTLDALKEIYEFPETTFFLARYHGMAAGFIILDFEGDNKEFGIIAGLGVLPQYQKRKIGTLLGLKAWEFFKENGVFELRCEVYMENKGSYEFIKSLGFKEYGQKTYRLDDFFLKYEMDLD